MILRYGNHDDPKRIVFFLLGVGKKVAGNRDVEAITIVLGDNDL